MRVFCLTGIPSLPKSARKKQGFIFKKGITTMASGKINV
jgi:hypothetical protein